MKTLGPLFENNRRWVESVIAEDPDFFHNLSLQQKPKHLWIGCSDSRVPANQIVGLLPGEMFVHRNISNVVDPEDLNCMSVIQFAVDVLEVEHIIVCGHYGCGGVQAALENRTLGLCDRWIQHVKRVRDKSAAELECTDKALRFNKLCELNVAEQVRNVAATATIRAAWERKQKLMLHGWIYAIENGLLRDLDVSLPAA